MKKANTKSLYLLMLFYFPFNSIFAEDTPFSRGVNLTGWFQASSAESIQFSKYTEKDFLNIKSLGCDVIRLPINLHGMTSGAPDYNVNPLLFTYLDQVIDWAEELEMHLILDNHSFDPAIETSPLIITILNPVWRQLAEHYKDRSELIYYEILNEPHGINDNLWNTIQLSIINSIREVDSIHTIIVGPAGWNSYNNLKFMQTYADTNIIYTFHFYDPFIFSHQGASWTDPSMVDLKDVPFPYDQNEMPNFPPSLIGTWINNSFNNYAYDGTIQRVKELIDIAVTFKNSRDIKIFCGEFGVYIPNSDNDDRVFWYETVRSYFEENGIAWTSWDYQGGFGLFENGSNELFDFDLNIPLIKALGLNEVPQMEYQNKQDSTGFSLYRDYIENGIVESSNISQGNLSLVDSFDPMEGSFSISWKDAAQYNFIGFNFIPNRDLSYLVESGFNLRFYLKVDSPTNKFDIRFIDGDNDTPGDHPWRTRYTIDETVLPFDNSWHVVDIPLSDFTEHGSWDYDNWYEPIGAFDWTDIDRFEFVAEYGDLVGASLWIDEIEIYDPNYVGSEKIDIVKSYILNQNYPNPFNPRTQIEFSIPEKAHVQLSVYNLLGQLVIEIIDENLKTGSYNVKFDAADLASGTYIYTIRANDYFDSRKMLLIK